MRSDPVQTTNSLTGPPAPPELEETLRSVVDPLAPLDREAGSDGERAAAELIAERLERRGLRGRRRRGELPGRVRRHAGRPCGRLSAAGRRRRAEPLAAAGGSARWAASLAAARIADDVSNGLRPLRRVAARKRTTWNVVAEAGDTDAERTLVLLAHHDAAHTGAIFDQTFQRLLVRTFPGVVERSDTALPIWWPVVGFPGLVAFGALDRPPRDAAASGLVGCAIGGGSSARHPPQPGGPRRQRQPERGGGAGRAWRRRCASGRSRALRVLLVSCGAEEVLQGGIYGFARRHLSQLDPERTWVLNLDTLGSPELILLEGEGPLVMEDYFDRGFRDLIARTADARGASRCGAGCARARAPTPWCRAGAAFPTATLSSMDRYKALSNYHQPSDTPDNLEYGTVGARPSALAEAVARRLAPARG